MKLFCPRTLIATSIFLSSISAIAAGSGPQVQKPQDPELPNARIQELKDDIKTIALANRDDTVNSLQVRNTLQPLINELVALTPSRSEAEKLDQVVGAWRNLWSDQQFGPGVDPAQVYQVVSDDGYYYNISLAHSPQGDVTNFLRGAYDDQGSYLAIEFTANSVRPGFFAPGTDLKALAANFEAGEIEAQPVPGPIGVTGALINAYVDDDLRIVTGNSTADSQLRLFILERVESVQVR